jgi:hypothetical protein
VKTVSTSYRLRNWSDYNRSLVGRGSLTLWIEESLSEVWLSQTQSGKRGASQTYSDRAVEICLSIRTLLHLPLRQTEGFVGSLLSLAGLPLPVPDYTTLSRRLKDLRVSLAVTPSRKPRHIVLDSTGLKVFGEGEWKVRKHGKDKRRTWKKLHLSVDEASGEVLAVEMTDGDAADGPLLPELVAESYQEGGSEIGQSSADGAYDSWDNDQFLTELGIKSTIPPRKSSKIRQHANCPEPPLQRDENLRMIRKVGREQWAKESQYTRRCLAETQMMRQKKILGGSLASRCQPNQVAECRLRCAILNRLTRLGMPDAYPVFAS